MVARPGAVRPCRAFPPFLPLLPFLPLPPNEPEDVVLRHPARDAGSGNPGDIDVVLLRDLANERRRSLPDHIVGRCRGRRLDAAAGAG